MRRDEKGEIQPMIALILLGMIVFVVTNALTSSVATNSRSAADNMRYAFWPTTTYATLNSTMTDNIYGVPTGWDNIVSENRIARLDNYGITNHFLQDNDNGCCYWRQSLTVTAFDAVASATVSFVYQISDNSGLAGGSHMLKVKLQRPGGDNVTVWENLSKIPADNGTWYTQENDIKSYINAAGTYYIYLYDNAVTAGNAATDNVVTRWDNAQLSIVAYVGSSSSSAGAGLIELSGGTLWGLVVLGVVAVMLMKMYGYM